MPQSSHIVFIHGLSNKPAADDLRRIWLTALRERVDSDPGFNLSAVGVRDTFIYWANHFYDQPLAASDYESRNQELQESVTDPVELPENEWMNSMRAHFPMDEDHEFEDAPVVDTTDAYERIPLPWVLKKKLMEHLLKEAHDYLFNVGGIRDTIRDQVVSALKDAEDDAPKVLVGHSQGSFIAYDVLTADIDCPEIDGFLTLGSPLGLDEIQDKLTWSRDNGFPEKLRGDWVNVYDPYDPVARVDLKLANDFKQNGQEKVIDVVEENWGRWRHSATKYLKGPKLRQHLRKLAGRS